MKEFQEKDPAEALADELAAQLARAGPLDANPYRRGRGNELISLMGHLFPRAARLALGSLPLGGDGWIPADLLGRLAEISERRGSGLMGLHPQGNVALLLGLDPSEASGPFAGPLWRGTQGPQGPASPLESCPLWGPCLGEEAGSLPRISGLRAALGEGIDPSLSCAVAGCPRDCRMLAERADLLVLLEPPGPGLSLWLGGRHRPFRPQPLPRPWRSFPGGDEAELSRFALWAQDLFLGLRQPRETLPELASRLGPDAFGGVFGG
jgi:hypothetical protein